MDSESIHAMIHKYCSRCSIVREKQNFDYCFHVLFNAWFFDSFYDDLISPTIDKGV